MSKVSRSQIVIGLAMAWVGGLSVAPLLAAGAAPHIELAVASAAVDFNVAGEAGAVTLRVSMPGGDVVERQFAAGAVPTLGLFRGDGSRLADGDYVWEMRSAATSARTRREAEAGGSGEAAGGWAASGSFAIRDGAVVPAAAAPRAAGAPPAGPTLATLDQVIPDDLIVQGSICAGFDCVNNESFGFDTIRMKENSTRIKFEDTSVGAFPANDWQLTANDSASGGANKFSIEDITGAKVPFTLTAGAPSNSIFVDSSGRVGLRTATPVLDLHINTSNTPGQRLEQNNSGGFTAQTWDIAGNEANFFVRDVTGGSRLPLRIRPGAPTSSLDISASGNVGIGTASPAAALDIVRSAGAVATIARFANNSGVQTLFDRTDAGANDWQMSNFNTTFQISVPGAATPQMSLNANGNMTIGGTQYLTGSSRSIKENFAEVDGRDILRRLTAMPLTSWNAIGDPTQRHIGPIAEDWFSTFGLGPDDKHVGMTDLGGVALAAIKGLSEEVEARDARLEAQDERLRSLERQNAELLDRLARLEAAREVTASH